MIELNYLHLQHFWAVAREGSIAAAQRKLMISQSTLSMQIRDLEAALKATLFHRRGRKLVLTAAGKVAFRYADDIFTLGRELIDSLSGRITRGPLPFLVGVADAIPKVVAYRLLRPALELPEPITLSCVEGRPAALLAQLSDNELDVVILDSPLAPTVRGRAFGHLLGECGVGIFGAQALARNCQREFPKSLDGQPFVLPARSSTLRAGLDHWFEKSGIRPRVVGEFEDSALLNVFGQHGVGLFAMPTVVARDLRRLHGVIPVGRVPDIKERFFAVSVDRTFAHPAVGAIARQAKEVIFT
ncbi:MAG: LysR family transcriptional regulator [Phycisphaerae bacterium]|nr:LysR family transcriptional regulator [Phycisphaerae bacterium]